MRARGFTAGQKTMENQDWATGPPGRLAVAGRGRWAVVGRGAWAMGRRPVDLRAVGRRQLGRGPVFSKIRPTC